MLNKCIKDDVGYVSINVYGISIIISKIILFDVNIGMNIIGKFSR